MLNPRYALSDAMLSSEVPNAGRITTDAKLALHFFCVEKKGV